MEICRSINGIRSFARIQKRFWQQQPGCSFAVLATQSAPSDELRSGGRHAELVQKLRRFPQKLSGSEFVDLVELPGRLGQSQASPFLLYQEHWFRHLTSSLALLTPEHIKSIVGALKRIYAQGEGIEQKSLGEFFAGLEKHLLTAINQSERARGAAKCGTVLAGMHKDQLVKLVQAYAQLNLTPSRPFLDAVLEILVPKVPSFTTTLLVQMVWSVSKLKLSQRNFSSQAIWTQFWISSLQRTIFLLEKDQINIRYLVQFAQNLHHCGVFSDKTLLPPNFHHLLLSRAAVRIRCEKGWLLNASFLHLMSIYLGEILSEDLPENVVPVLLEASEYGLNNLKGQQLSVSSHDELTIMAALQHWANLLQILLQFHEKIVQMSAKCEKSPNLNLGQNVRVVLGKVGGIVEEMLQVLLDQCLLPSLAHLPKDTLLAILSAICKLPKGLQAFDGLLCDWLESMASHWSHLTPQEWSAVIDAFHWLALPFDAHGTHPLPATYYWQAKTSCASEAIAGREFLKAVKIGLVPSSQVLRTVCLGAAKWTLEDCVDIGMAVSALMATPNSLEMGELQAALCDRLRRFAAAPDVSPDQLHRLQLYRLACRNDQLLPLWLNQTLQHTNFGQIFRNSFENRKNLRVVTVLQGAKNLKKRYSFKSPNFLRPLGLFVDITLEEKGKACLPQVGLFMNRTDYFADLNLEQTDRLRPEALILPHILESAGYTVKLLSPKLEQMTDMALETFLHNYIFPNDT